jgi:ribosomal protein S8
MMILNNLKNAIRNKKAYFTVKYSKDNIKNLLVLQKNDIIMGFTVAHPAGETKHLFILVFVRYCNNLDASITSFCVNLAKLSNYQNQILQPSSNALNFVITNSEKKTKKPKLCVKFR